MSVFVKGMILARPVFDGSRSQWFTNRALSVGKALLLVSPLALMYWVSPRFLPGNTVRFVLVNTIAAAYGLLGMRWILMRLAREQSLQHDDPFGAVSR